MLLWNLQQKVIRKHTKIMTNDNKLMDPMMNGFIHTFGCNVQKFWVILAKLDKFNINTSYTKTVASYFLV